VIAQVTRVKSLMIYVCLLGQTFGQYGHEYQIVMSYCLWEFIWATI